MRWQAASFFDRINEDQYGPIAFGVCNDDSSCILLILSNTNHAEFPMKFAICNEMFGDSAVGQ